MDFNRPVGAIINVKPCAPDGKGVPPRDNNWGGLEFRDHDWKTASSESLAFMWTWMLNFF